MLIVNKGQYNLKEPLRVEGKTDKLSFKYFSDLVFDTMIFDIPILSINSNEDSIIYMLDLSFLIGEVGKNQKNLNNFSQIRSSEGGVLICLVAFEQNEYKIIFA